MTPDEEKPDVVVDPDDQTPDPVTPDEEKPDVVVDPDDKEDTDPTDKPDEVVEPEVPSEEEIACLASVK